MFKIALKYGVLIVLFSIVWLGLEYLVGMHTEYVTFHPLLTLLTLVIPLLLLAYGMREAQKNYTGYFSYGESFKTGLYITLVVAVLNPLMQWLLYSLAFPGFFEGMQANVEAQQLAEGVDVEVARRQAEEGYNLGRYLWQSFIGTLIAGVVISAITAIFIQDKTLPKGG